MRPQPIVLAILPVRSGSLFARNGRPLLISPDSSRCPGISFREIQGKRASDRNLPPVVEPNTGRGAGKLRGGLELAHLLR